MPLNQNSSQISSQFWMMFGKYMAPVLSAEGEKINWINYKTGVRYLRFKMKVNKSSITIAIELEHPDSLLQQQQFDVLLNLKKQFQTICGNNWNWEKEVVAADNKVTARVVATLQNVSILNQSQWPDIISFFKTNLIVLDEFWCKFRFAFE